MGTGELVIKDYIDQCHEKIKITNGRIEHAQEQIARLELEIGLCGDVLEEHRAALVLLQEVMNNTEYGRF